MGPLKVESRIENQATLHEHPFSPIGKILTALFLISCTLAFAIRTIHWPLVNDAVLLHYIAFLIDHGFRPYRDILDPNMPGSYLIDWTVIHTLGAGPLGSRLYDLLLLLSAGLAMTVLAWRRSKFAALYAACLFALFHGRDGMLQIGQRDLAVAVGLLWAIAFAALLLRRNGLLWAFALGLTIGLITTIKPYGLLTVALCVPLYRLLPPKRRNLILATLLAGVMTPLLSLAIYLLHFGLLQPFLFTLFVLIPLHMHLGFPGLWHLIQSCLTPSLLVLGALCLLAIRTTPHSEKRIERHLLLIGIAVGLVGYLMQLKGFPYHRYPLIACLLLLAALELTEATRHPGPSRWIGLTGLLFGVVLAPLYMQHALRSRWPNDMEAALRTDLNALGGDHLSRSIQCIDSIEGCTRVLYDMHLVQSTGVMYDEFLFLAHPTPEVLLHRQAFLQAIEKAEPRVIVVTPDLFPSGPTADRKLLIWPEFNQFLSHCYDEKTERTFPHGSPSEPGYRLYEAAHRCHT